MCRKKTPQAGSRKSYIRPKQERLYRLKSGSRAAWTILWNNESVRGEMEREGRGGGEEGGTSWIFLPAYTTMPTTVAVFLTIHPLRRRLFRFTPTCSPFGHSLCAHIQTRGIIRRDQTKIRMVKKPNQVHIVVNRPYVSQYCLTCWAYYHGNQMLKGV